MKRSSYGYGSYRGRSGTSAVLKGIIVVLAIILVLAVAAFFYLQRYMVYSDDGTARLELPFLRREEPAASLPPVVTQVPEPTPTPEPSPEPSLRPERILPVSLPREALYDGSAAELVTGGGGTAALFDMKGDSGELLWVSDEPLAIAARSSAGDPALNVAVRAAAGEDGVYRIARVSCFKDDRLSDADTSLAILTNSGYRWTDSEKVHWVSPTNPTVRAYLVNLCRELAGLGFDEILLDNAGYPTRGKLGYIKKGEAYDAEAFESVISGFYREVADTLEGTGVVLSVVYDGETAASSGQSEEGIRAAGALAVTRNEDGVLTWP